MPSQPLSVKGIILETVPYKDKDRMVSFLTRDKGIIKFCAKGVAKVGSRNAFAGVPFSVCDVTLSESHGFYYLKEGTIIESNSGIMDSIEAIAVGTHFAECLMDSVFQSEDSSNAYKLAVYAFYALSKGGSDFIKIYGTFNWKLLSLMGFTITYGEGGDRLLSLREGSTAEYNGVIPDGYMKMSGKAIKLLDLISESPVENVFTIRSTPEIYEEVRIFTTGYLSYQFDKYMEDPVKKLGLP